MTLLFRVDASARMGWGHVMRCLALAESIRERRGRAIFLLKQPSTLLVKRLRREGLTVQTTRARAGSVEDAAHAADLAKRHGAHWVVADGYQFGAEFQKGIKNAGCQLLMIDDYGHASSYEADLILNQNLYAKESLYPRRNRLTELLVGSNYVLLRKAFRRGELRRRQGAKASRILVTMGGSDPHGVTLKVLQGLAGLKRPDLEVRAVVAQIAPSKAFTDFEKRMPQGFGILRNVLNMPALMAWADLAVSAGGTTCYEMASMGLPNIIVTIAANQIAVARALHQAGVSIYLSHHNKTTPAGVRSAVVRLLANTRQRSAMSRKGTRLLDRKGTDRALDAIEAKTLTLRPVKNTDSRLLWRWANDRDVRRSSFSPAPISWDQHQRWFQAKRSSSTSVIYIGSDASGRPVGQLRLDLCRPNHAAVDVHTAPESRGRGFGARLISQGIREACRGGLSRLFHAYIRKENQSSLRAFEKAGFRKQGIQRIEGNLVWHSIFKCTRNRN